MTLEAADSYDAVFKNRFHAELAFNIPFGPRAKARCDSCCSIKEQYWLQQWAHDPPNRQEILVTDTQKKTSVAIDPGNGQPFFLLFVNNLSSSLGTYESPYKALATAQANASPGNVIYVYPGDGTSSFMDAGIDLSGANTANVRVLGSGVGHGFETNLGYLKIPAQTASLPSIANTNAAPVVILGINNEFSGFNILDPSVGQLNISGIWNGVSTSATISQNVIYNNSFSGIDLQATNSTLNLVVDGNQIYFPSFVTMSTQDGIVCTSNSSNVKAKISNNTIWFPVGQAIDLVGNGSSKMDVDVLSNFMFNALYDFAAGRARGVKVSALGASTVINTLVDSNHIVGSAEISPIKNGIYCETDSSAQQVSVISNNTIIRVPAAFSQAILIHSLATSLPDSVTNTTLLNNYIYGGFGIFLHTEPGGAGPIHAVIDGNTIQYAVGSQVSPGAIGSISVGSDGIGSINTTIQKNRILGDGHVTEFGITCVGQSAIGQDTILIKDNYFERFENSITLDLKKSTDVAINSNFIDQHFNIGAPEPAFDLAFDAGTYHIQIQNNTFENTYWDVRALLTGGATSCIDIDQNLSVNDFVIDNSLGGVCQFQIPSSNFGNCSFSGDITFVP